MLITKINVYLLKYQFIIVWAYLRAPITAAFYGTLTLPFNF